MTEIFNNVYYLNPYIRPTTAHYNVSQRFQPHSTKRTKSVMLCWIWECVGVTGGSGHWHTTALILQRWLQSCVFVCVYMYVCVCTWVCMCMCVCVCEREKEGGTPQIPKSAINTFSFEHRRFSTLCERWHTVTLRMFQSDNAVNQITAVWYDKQTTELYDKSILPVQLVGYKMDDPRFDSQQGWNNFFFQEAIASLKAAGTWSWPHTSI